MKHYINNDSLIYVLNENDKLIYVINEFEVNDRNLAIAFHLNLIVGWDYINPDKNDIMGWCTADNFSEEVQHDIIYQYVLKEKLAEALEAHGYIIIEELPKF